MIAEVNQIIDSLQNSINKGFLWVENPEFSMPCDGLIHLIKSLHAPAVDAVEVIRCKDCQAYGRSPYNHPTIGWCKLHGHHRNPDYYCASGKRKETKHEA